MVMPMIFFALLRSCNSSRLFSWPLGVCKPRSPTPPPSPKIFRQICQRTPFLCTPVCAYLHSAVWKWLYIAVSLFSSSCTRIPAEICGRCMFRMGHHGEARHPGTGAQASLTPQLSHPSPCHSFQLVLLPDCYYSICYVTKTTPPPLALSLFCSSLSRTCGKTRFSDDALPRVGYLD